MHQSTALAAQIAACIYIYHVFMPGVSRLWSLVYHHGVVFVWTWLVYAGLCVYQVEATCI